jgi:DNA-binding NtrC family response regulator
LRPTGTPSVGGNPSSECAAPLPATAQPREALRRIDELLFLTTVRTSWGASEVATRLGITRARVYQRLKELRIHRSEIGRGKDDALDEAIEFRRPGRWPAACGGRLR